MNPPRNTNCSSCKVSNYMLKQSPFNPADWYCQSCQCIFGLFETKRRYDESKRKPDIAEVQVKKKVKGVKRKRASTVKPKIPKINKKEELKAASIVDDCVVEVPCKGTVFDYDITVSADQEQIAVDTMVVTTAPIPDSTVPVLFKVKDARKSTQIKSNVENEDLFLSRSAKAKLMELEKNIQVVKFPVDSQVLIADAANVLWPGKVIAVQRSKRLITYHGWDSNHDEWIDCDSKRLFESSEKIDQHIPDSKLVKVVSRQVQSFNVEISASSKA